MQNPRHYLRYLFKRTRSARKSNKRIAEPYHLRLALGHTGCYYQLGQSVVLNVALDKNCVSTPIALPPAESTLSANSPISPVREPP